MFALKSERGRRPAEVGLVLPRWLRRPVRMLRRIDVERMESPRFGATIATGLLFALTGLYGGLAGGHMDEVIRQATSRVGFAIENIEVTGNRETSEIDILQRIGLDGWTSMVGFDVQAARLRIAELAWVERAEVRKVYPATLVVKIVEREPFALWQRDSRLSVIERDGDVIAPFYGGHLASLPLLIGEGAREAGPAFVEQVARVRGLSGRVRAYIRVADRRWDLRLDNGITIRLPERNVEAALAEVSRLDGQYALLSRDIESVDLRLADRLVVALTPESAEKRAAAFEDMLSQRRGGASI
ncbi:cell division protein FtsQ/DivIB [Chelativorans intermedius]|uniref:Cell division protein FtsQ n=1 Tax=Chelativorans intermedius TaxID=515947 RepID=A0ABV6D823_9HYPH|nr:cell division protein FtsQ/DivIB [Chelativorans intermedius]MCT8996880.1 cell division protein FtsQ/DivIB [Chelativorans intermedius]